MRAGLTINDSQEKRRLRITTSFNFKEIRKII